MISEKTDRPDASEQSIFDRPDASEQSVFDRPGSPLKIMACQFLIRLNNLIHILASVQVLLLLQCIHKLLDQ